MREALSTSCLNSNYFYFLSHIQPLLLLLKRTLGKNLLIHLFVQLVIVFRKDRKGPGGGVALFIRSDLVAVDVTSKIRT
jgi:hypothetical protein